jgi:hypothetical protein
VEDEDYGFGINLLQCSNVASRNARRDTYTKAYNVFYKIWEEEFGPWLQLILQNVLRAFIENQDYTLADVPMFLESRNKDFRNHIIDNIQYEPAVADFWRYEFFERREPEQQARVDAALTRINTLLTDPDVREIVGQQKTTLNFKTLLTLPNILLFKFPSNLAEDMKKFIGTILLSELVYAVRDRPEDKRTQFCIFVDEFHNFASSDHMGTLVTEGRKFGAAGTFIHVERFGQLAHNQKLMGATQAIANKAFFQMTVKDAEEFAPEFAKEVELTEKRWEAELIISPRPVEDIWEQGHPHEEIMWIRGRYFWIVELLRNQPNEKYFVFNPSWTAPKYRSINPLTFNMQDFTDWDFFRSSADQIRQGISLWNQYLFDWMRGKYDPSECITDEQIELAIKIIECLGGIFGFLSMMRPYIPNEKHERLLYLMNEQYKQNYEQEKRQQIQAIKNERQHIEQYGVKPIEGLGFAGEFQSEDHDLVLYRRNDVIYWKKGTKKQYDYEQKYLKELSEKILQLEQSQTPHYSSLPSSVVTSRNMNEIKRVAIQAGMPSHEVEEFIEWELNPFTSEERSALSEYIAHVAHLVNYLKKHEDDADNKYYDTRMKKADLFLQSAGKRYIPQGESSYATNRFRWQNHELWSFIYLFVGDEPRTLAKEPIKIPSGKYDESLRVERPQHDLVTDTVLAMTRLPRYQANVKIIDENKDTQIVRTRQIQTYPLPKINNTDMVAQAITNGHTLCKKREDIEAEIRERQSRWRGGSGSPRTRERE